MEALSQLANADTWVVALCVLVVGARVMWILAKG